MRKKGQFKQVPCHVTISPLSSGDNNRLVRMDLVWESPRRSIKVVLPRESFADALFGTAHVPATQLVRVEEGE